jgi:hypothetical protein
LLLKDPDSMLPDDLLLLMERSTHRNAQSLASWLREMIQPSLLESTTTGLPNERRIKDPLAGLQKKLLQSSCNKRLQCAVERLNFLFLASFGDALFHAAFKGENFPCC